MSDEQEQAEPLTHADRPLAVQLARRLQEARDAFPEPPCGEDELSRQHRKALERHLKANEPK